MKTILRYCSPLLCLCIVSINSIKAQGVINTIAGNGITQYIGDGWPADSFSLALPKSICIDKRGKVYVADYADSRIRTVYYDTLKTIAGVDSAGDAGDGGLADTATLRNPDGVCLDTAGNIYITEWYNDLIRKIDVNTGIISTICGIGGGGFGGDGGPADSALLSSPGGACTDRAGNIYIPDYYNQRIRKVTVSIRDISTIAGTGANGYAGDSGLAVNAHLSYPNSVCTDTSGNVYFSEVGNNTVRKIDVATGIITTVAGKGTQGYSGDGHLAVNAQLADPQGIFMDKKGYLYIADYNNNVIRLVTPAGIIYTIAGNGGFGYTGDGGAPLNATFKGPTAVCTDDSGYVYIADGLNSVIRKMSPVQHLGIEEIVKPYFNIYPNPSTGKFSVIAGEKASAIFKVSDVNGQCVYITSCICSRMDIDLSGYSAGIYFVQYTASGGSAADKVIIH